MYLGKMSPPKLNVREIQLGDIPLIADYWSTSDPDFLEGMGVDLAKLPSSEAFTQMLTHQIQLPITEKQSYALIWEIDGKPSGHSNVNQIRFGVEAFMHLHLWQGASRQRGLGEQLVRLSLPFYFERLQLLRLFCEPYALNPAPNKTLPKLGFELVKRYTTIPGSINTEQEVNRWVLKRGRYLALS
jgi:ribosomal-protein-alanine N-acetyltransferase